MLRLFLRLYLLLAVGFGGAIFVVDHVISTLFAPSLEEYNREAVRGQAYALTERLRQLDAAGRARQMDDWRPHYGLRLELKDASDLALDERERKLILNDLLVTRENYTRYISRIDDGPQLLVIDLPAEPAGTLLYTIGAYLLLGFLVGLVLFLWVRPHWRNLETLRLAAQRFGDGDLGTRTPVFRGSDCRKLAEHFNQMADRIESLISNQRELTNAVSHELRTPLPASASNWNRWPAAPTTPTTRPWWTTCAPTWASWKDGLRTAHLRAPGAQRRRLAPREHRRRQLAGKRGRRCGPGSRSGRRSLRDQHLRGGKPAHRATLHGPRSDQPAAQCHPPCRPPGGRRPPPGR